MILITGASGHVGRRVAELLAERGHTLRLMARDPNKAPQLPSVQVVPGDYSDPTLGENVRYYRTRRLCSVYNQSIVILPRYI